MINEFIGLIIFLGPFILLYFHTQKQRKKRAEEARRKEEERKQEQARLAELCRQEETNYYKSSYYKITKNPYEMLEQDSGVCGEYFTYVKLQHLENYGCKFLFNLFIPKVSGGTTEIDVLLISSKGLVVFESKNYSGWILGTESERFWTQSLCDWGGDTHKERFYNPIMQNQTHIKNLRALIGTSIPLYSVIVFSERCELKRVVFKSNDVCVVNRYDVVKTVLNILNRTSEDILTENDIADLYSQLYPYSQVSNNVKNQHISNLHSKEFIDC